MEVHKIIVAIALLVGPDPTTEMDDPVQICRVYGPTVQKVAVEWEILDPRETGHMLCEPVRFIEDLRELRRRCKELAGAPLQAESQRFPERQIINEWLTLNRIYLEELRQRLIYDNIHREEVQMALQETEMLYRIWDRVQEARRKFYYITVRRRALLDLREMVGDAAFYSGQLPPPVPLWRLPRWE